MKSMELAQRRRAGSKETQQWLAQVKRHRFIYLLLAPAVVLTVIFCYLPLPGLRIAFMDFDIYEQFQSPYVGFKNIIGLFRIPMFTKAIANTLTISVLTLLTGFPMAVIFALLLNEVQNAFFKRIIQTVSYLPYFLSWISVIGIVSALYSINGAVNDVRIAVLGETAKRIMFLAQQKLFVPNVLFLDLWKGMGWGSIIYLAAISSVDTALYEAAVIDGAGRFKQMLHVTLPCISPTIVIMMIYRLGGLFADNFELIYGLQNAYIDFDVVQTVIYKQGIEQGNFSMTTAFGFMQGLVGFALLFMVNYGAKKTSGISIW